MKNGILMLRATVGASFVTHGAGKLFGVGPGGHGLSATAQAFEGMGLRPGIVQATAAGATELGAGVGLLLGYRTPLAASGVVATMVTAIHRVHGKNGYDVTQGGFEYNAVLIAAALTVAEQGPGALSLDALRGKQRHGLVTGLVALGVGIGGALVNARVADFLGGGAAGPADAGGATVADSGPVEVAVEEPATAPLTVEQVPGGSETDSPA